MTMKIPFAPKTLLINNCMYLYFYYANNRGRGNSNCTIILTSNKTREGNVKAQNQIRRPAMITYYPTTKFVTPPENQGQIVIVSYALDADAEVIIKRTHDASNNSIRFDAYSYPDDDSGEWTPWNESPELGTHLGQCKIEA